MLAVRLVHVEGAGEGIPRVDARILEAGQSSKEHVHLHLRAAGEVIDRCGLATHEPIEHRGRAVREHVIAGDLQSVGAHDRTAGIGVDGGHGCRQPDVGAEFAGPVGECPGECAHAADRNIPVAGAVPDDVVEEADVLMQ